MTAGEEAENHAPETCQSSAEAPGVHAQSTNGAEPTKKTAKKGAQDPYLPAAKA